MPPEAFDAPMIVALSDADMVPSAYVDGRLGPAAGKDRFTVLRFDGGSLRPSSAAGVPISASVTGPPAPDGDYAGWALCYRDREPRPPSRFGEDIGIAGLSHAKTITIVDLANGAGPKVVQVKDGPRQQSPFPSVETAR